MATRKTLTIYEYPKCSTCRNALKYLEARGVAFRKIDITEQTPTKAELKTMLAYYGGELRKLFNTSGEQYRALKLSEKVDQMSESEAINLLAQNGKLIKRPFLVAEGAGLVGFKEDEWDEVIGSMLGA